MKREAVWFVVRITIILVTVAVLLTRGRQPLNAQEKDTSYPPTRQWQVARWDDYTKATLDAVDTAGVCVYVLRGYFKDTVALAAVPKTQLPKGAGCQ